MALPGWAGIGGDLRREQGFAPCRCGDSRVRAELPGASCGMWAGCDRRTGDHFISSEVRGFVIPAEPCEHAFVTAQGSAYMRFRRALDRGNVTEALSAASELQFVGLAEALELTLLLADAEPEKYERAAARWHFASRRRSRTSTSARAWRCSPSSLRSRRTAWPLPPWPSSSAGDDPASGSRRPCALVAGGVELAHRDEGRKLETAAK